MDNFKKVYNPFIIENEITKHQAPYTDGKIEYLKVTDEGVKIAKVVVTQEEWEALRMSKDAQRKVLR